MMPDYTVRLGGQTAPDRILVEVRKLYRVVEVQLPNPVTVAVWNECGFATLVTEHELDYYAGDWVDGDVRFQDGRMLAEVGKVDWPPGDPNPPGMEPTDPNYQPPAIFDAVIRDPVLDTYDLATGEAPGDSG